MTASEKEQRAVDSNEMRDLLFSLKRIVLELEYAGARPWIEVDMKIRNDFQNAAQCARAIERQYKDRNEQKQRESREKYGEPMGRVLAERES